MQAFYDNKPSVLEAVGNGSYRYRYDIEEVLPELTEGEVQTERTSSWKCEEVVVWSPVTANKITEKVLTERWDANYEQKLVNEYKRLLIETNKF